MGIAHEYYRKLGDRATRVQSVVRRWKSEDGERLRFCAGESIATPLRRAETDSFD